MVTGIFVGWLRLDYVNGREWIVVNPVVSHERFGFKINDGRTIYPDDQFKTDFASIPRPFWRILPPVGDGSRARYGVAAVIHDWLYACHKVDVKPISRKFADDVFFAAMKAVQVSEWRLQIMYRAVRWFGGMAWKNGDSQS